MKKILSVLLASGMLLVATNVHANPINPTTSTGGSSLIAGITSLGAGVPSSAIPVVTLPLLLITIPVGVITTVVGGIITSIGLLPEESQKK